MSNYSTRIQDQNDGYESLVAAIIRQACYDYKLESREEIKRFFYSDWFQVLTKIDGPTLFRKIEENFTLYGTGMPFTKT